MTKILFNGNRIIFDGHADTAEECRAITAMCDSMANNENFKTIVYEDGHAVFEQVSGGDSELFMAMKDWVLTSRYNKEVLGGTSYDHAKAIQQRLIDLETAIGYLGALIDYENGKGSIIERLRNLEALIGTLPEGVNTVIGYVNRKAYAPKCQLPITASELAQKLGITLAPEPESGLYDASGVQLASWDKLVNYYDMEIEAGADNTTPAYILNNNIELSTGVKFIIPKEVTSIGDSAFSGCTSLTSIIIPDSVTSIGDSAFRDCIGLTSLIVDAANPKYHSNGNCIIETAGKTLISGCKTSVIPTDGSVTSIGDYAFRGCTGLTSINIPDGVTSIGERAFSGCTGLTSIVIPDSVTSIDFCAFEDCTGLTSVTIGNGVTSISGYDFYGCTGLTSVTIGSGVTSIDSYAFNDCTGLTSITVDPNNTTYHSDGNCLIETASKTLILGCETSVIPADGSVTSIGSSAFYGCTGLTNIEIPDSVTSIGHSAFGGCTGLTNIEIPDSVTSIDYHAFGSCTSLTSVTIGSGVTSINYFAFDDCDNLTTINVPWAEGAVSGAPWGATNAQINYNYTGE